MFRMKHHQSPETSFVFIKIYQICIYKMNFKSIVWFIKATSYSVLLRSLGNTSKVIMSVSLIRHTTYCYFSTFHLCTGQNYFFYCCFLRRHQGVETAIWEMILVELLQFLGGCTRSDWQRIVSYLARDDYRRDAKYQNSCLTFCQCYAGSNQ